MKVKMLSKVGKIHDKVNRIRTPNKLERQKLYSSSQTAYTPRKTGEIKFSPFNTVSRESRNSYLLRVTNQPNTQTNYEVTYSSILKRDRRSTIDQASFKRIIGPVNDQDYSIQLNSKDKRCANSFTQSNRPKPLTARDTQKWRKQYENLDFTKQVNPQRLCENSKQMRSTRHSDLKSIIDITQSNFNNYNRFSMVPKRQKSHDFNSDTGHKYLQEVFGRTIQPQYDILASNQQKLRKSMRRPKGELRFGLFCQQIKTRVDRSDPHWVQTLDYDSSPSSILLRNRTIDFEVMQKRHENQVNSKYPLRLALRKDVPNNLAI